MKIFAIPLMTTILAVSACSQAAEHTSKLAEASPVSLAPTVEAAGNWHVITDDSHVKFTATQQGTEFTGEFKSFNAIINFDEDAIDKANVTAAIDLGSVAAGDKDRDGALPGKEWFNVKAFPKAVFQSDNFVKTDENTYEARGTLSMKGNSQPLTLPFKLDINGARADMASTVDIDRTLWDVGTGAWSTNEWVSTKVTVDVKIKATRP